MAFSTRDRDNDNGIEVDCAHKYKGAWWYNACHHSNLNGMYLGGANTEFACGINWFAWHGHEYSLKFVSMKIRPK